MLWKYPEVYKRMIILIDGLHQVQMEQRKFTYNFLPNIIFQTKLSKYLAGIMPSCADLLSNSPFGTGSDANVSLNTSCLKATFVLPLLYLYYTVSYFKQRFLFINFKTRCTIYYCLNE